MTRGYPRTDRDSYIGNLLLPLTILLLAVVSFFVSLDFPKGEGVGPAAVPFLWIAFTVIFSGVLVIQALLKHGKSDPIPGKVRFVLLFVGWLTVYVASINTIGYFISTLVFLAGSMYILTYRNHLVIFITSSVWLAFSYIVFVKILFIPLPVGPILRPFLE